MTSLQGLVYSLFVDETEIPWSEKSNIHYPSIAVFFFKLDPFADFHDEKIEDVPSSSQTQVEKQQVPEEEMQQAEEEQIIVTGDDDDDDQKNVYYDQSQHYMREDDDDGRFFCSKNSVILIGKAALRKSSRTM